MDQSSSADNMIIAARLSLSVIEAASGGSIGTLVDATWQQRSDQTAGSDVVDKHDFIGKGDGGVLRKVLRSGPEGVQVIASFTHGGANFVVPGSLTMQGTQVKLCVPLGHRPVPA